MCIKTNALSEDCKNGQKEGENGFFQVINNSYANEEKYSKRLSNRANMAKKRAKQIKETLPQGGLKCRFVEACEDVMCRI